MKNIRVIIAENHEELLRALVLWLGGKFEIATTVKNGKYLVEEAMALRPDVIVSDVVMPGLTGPQAQKELAARGCQVPFVFLTSDTDLLVQGIGSVVDKLDAAGELEPAIRATASGTKYVSRRLSPWENRRM